MTWIDCKQKLPESGAEYLATDGHDVEVMTYFGTYKGHPEWSSYRCNTLHVTHWMEIPKPPDKK